MFVGLTWARFLGSLIQKANIGLSFHQVALVVHLNLVTQFLDQVIHDSIVFLQPLTQEFDVWIALDQLFYLALKLHYFSVNFGQLDQSFFLIFDLADFDSGESFAQLAFNSKRV